MGKVVRLDLRNRYGRLSRGPCRPVMSRAVLPALTPPPDRYLDDGDESIRSARCVRLVPSRPVCMYAVPSRVNVSPLLV